MHLQVQPVGVFVVVGFAGLHSFGRNFCVGNFTQGTTVAHHAVQLPYVGPVVRFGIGNVDVQTTAAVGEVEQIVSGGDDKRLFSQQNAVPIHQGKGKGLTNSNGLNTDGNKAHKDF